MVTASRNLRGPQQVRRISDDEGSFDVSANTTRARKSLSCQPSV